MRNSYETSSIDSSQLLTQTIQNLIAYHYIKVIVLNVTIIQTKGTKMAPLFIHVFSEHLLIVLTLENLHQISWIELQQIEIVLCC